MFVRKLHDKQRRRIIEPLRHRFEEKLKMKDYICNHCGSTFKPIENAPCGAHQLNSVKTAPSMGENVRNNLKSSIFTKNDVFNKIKNQVDP